VPTKITTTISEAHRRVEPPPAGEEDREAREDHAERDPGVRRHVQIGAPDVEIAPPPRGEEEGGGAIDDDADERHRDDRPPGGRLRVGEAHERLPADRPDREQQEDGVEQGGEDRAAAQSVGAAYRRAAADQDARAPGEEEAQHVAEVVPGVRDEGERAGEDAEDRLDDDETGVQRDADREGPAKVRRGVAVRVSVIVGHDGPSLPARSRGAGCRGARSSAWRGSGGGARR